MNHISNTFGIEFIGLISSVFEMLEDIYKNTLLGKTPQEVHLLAHTANNFQRSQL